MYAIIRLGNGKFYTSPVFGYYKNPAQADDYFSYYYIVFNRENDRLIRCDEMEQDTKYLIPRVIIVDTDTTDWLLEEDGTGGVSFLPRETADAITESENTPSDILEKCLNIVQTFRYDEYAEIRNEKDIQNFYAASFGLHDACLEEEKLLDEQTLYVKFAGTWQRSVEIWFRGEISYHTEPRKEQFADPYWYTSSIILSDGFVYLVDDDNVSPEELNENDCYFKARKMTYRILPH
ncbi:MAG: hypothetical protein IJ489_05975 [Clostridia bacterium]|nr:hypothetical protein [Clostridia bacterium]